MKKIGVKKDSEPISAPIEWGPVCSGDIKCDFMILEAWLPKRSSGEFRPKTASILQFPGHSWHSKNARAKTPHPHLERSASWSMSSHKNQKKANLQRRQRDEGIGSKKLCLRIFGRIKGQGSAISAAQASNARPQRR